MQFYEILAAFRAIKTLNYANSVTILGYLHSNNMFIILLLLLSMSESICMLLVTI
jgi:hypothetical protein